MTVIVLGTLLVTSDESPYSSLGDVPGARLAALDTSARETLQSFVIEAKQRGVSKENLPEDLETRFSTFVRSVAFGNGNANDDETDSGTLKAILVLGCTEFSLMLSEQRQQSLLKCGILCVDPIDALAKALLYETQ